MKRVSVPQTNKIVTRLKHFESVMRYYCARGQLVIDLPACAC